MNLVNTDLTLTTMKENTMIGKKKTEKSINKKMSFAQIMQDNPDAIEILLEKGMHCIGCPMSMQETLEQGALAHGLNPDELVKEINKKTNEPKNIKNKK
jgi:hybrid cluster-associated redox disulfide protein